MPDGSQVGATVDDLKTSCKSCNDVCGSDECKKHKELHDKAAIWLVHADSSRTALDVGETDCGKGTCQVTRVADWEPCVHKKAWRAGREEDSKVAGFEPCKDKEAGLIKLDTDHCKTVIGAALETETACAAKTSLVWQTSPLAPGELSAFKPVSKPVCTYTPPKLAAGRKAINALPRAVVKMSQERKRVAKFKDLVERQVIDETTGQFLNLEGELGVLPLRYYQKQCGHPQDYSNYCDEDDSVETVGPLTPEESKQACENDACTALPRPTFPFGLVVRVTHKHAYTQATRQAHTLTHEHTVSQSPL